MSLLNENILPGKTGRIFRTNAKNPKDLRRVAQKVLDIKGINDVGINTKTFPVEFTIHAADFSIVSIKDIERAALNCGFHLIPKSNF